MGTSLEFGDNRFYCICNEHLSLVPYFERDLRFVEVFSCLIIAETFREVYHFHYMLRLCLEMLMDSALFSRGGGGGEQRGQHADWRFVEDSECV